MTQINPDNQNNQNNQETRMIEITPHDLPLHCHGAKNEPWNGHPRVFLPIQSFGLAECPYCGTIYKLNGEIKGHH